MTGYLSRTSFPLSPPGAGRDVRADTNAEGSKPDLSRALTGVGAPQTMSSREIADLTEKDHRNVLRDGRAMLAELHGEGSVLRFEHTLLNEQNGQSYPVLLLPKRETLILVSGYNLKLRTAIIDRWEELERAAAASAFDIPQTKAEALRLAADLADKVEQQQVQIALMVPKVYALDRLMGLDGPQCLRAAAKLVGVPERQFIKHLHAKGWIFRHQGKGPWLGYSHHEKAGRLEHVASTYEGRDRSDRFVTQLKLTPKGIGEVAMDFAPKSGEMFQ